MKTKQHANIPYIKLMFWSILTLWLSPLQAQTTTVNFTTAGSSTWTCPPGVTSIQVEAWGGGGGGCGTSSNTSRSAGGGAGGSYVKNTAISVTPGATYTILVGAGGTGGVGNPSTNPPTAGGISSITQVSDGTLLLRAGGGAAGGAATSTQGGAGGLGSTAQNFGYSGTFNYKGGDGGTGINGTPAGTAGTAAAGGGAGGSNGNGSGITAGTGGGNGAAAITSSGSGNAGNAPGGGGGGGMSAAASAKNGGNGGAGKITISYATPNPPTVNVNVSSLSITQATGSALSAQSFVLSGSLLTANVVVSTISNSALEVSTDNTNFSSSVSLAPAGDGSIANTNIYVRVKSTATAVSSSETITVSSTNATSKTVTVAFVIYKNYYLVNGSDVVNLSNWWSNTNGTGTNPANFIADAQYFNIITNGTTSGSGWAVSGSGSKVIVGASNVGAVTFTIASGAPMTGTLDVSAATGGASNKILVQHDIQQSTSLNIFTNPTWGTLDANTILEFSGTTNAIIGGSGNLFNKTIKSLRVVNNGVARFNGVGGNAPSIGTEVYVEAGSALYSGQNSLSYINILNGGSLTLNGTLGTDKTTGWISNDASPSATSGAINFVGTVNMTLGSNSTIDFTRLGSSTAQTIAARSDYQNMNLSGNDAAKTFAGATTIAGKLNVSYYNATTTRAITAGAAITASELVFNGSVAQTVSPTNMPFLSNVNAPITFKNNSGVVLGADNTFPDNLAYKMGGGTLSSGATAGFSDTFGTLNLAENTTLALGTGAHTLQFANSSAISWTSGKFLTITGWTGSLGQSGTAGKIFVGLNGNGLTSAQLSQIIFAAYPTAAAIQLSSGEIVPQCSNPTSGGSISSNQTICSGQTPNTLNNISLPSGQIGNAALEYQWQSSTDNATFVDISGANATSYSPGSLSSTTYYRRLSRMGCMTDWTGATASNTITITVNTTSSPSATASQSFCSGASVSQLSASGTAVQWYTASNGGTALASSQTLSTGIYYASQTLNGCESNRTSVAVSVQSTTAPTANAQSGCTGATVSSLTANGTQIQWYAAAVGGSALSNDTQLTSSTYYATQTLNGCESSRTAVQVTMYNTTAPTATSQWMANGATVSQLTATGSALAWYASATGGSALAGSEVVQTGTYYVSQTQNGCESTRKAVAVTVYNPDLATTSVVNSQCGSTLTSIWDVIRCTAVSGASTYRFEITFAGNATYFDSASNSFQLTQMNGGAQFTSTYGIRVATFVGGAWSNFGNSCTVTTPAAPAPITINAAFCGATLSQIETPIFCPQVQGATAYRFEVSRGTYVEVIDRSNNVLVLSQLNTAPVYNATYNIRVAVLYNGAYGAYGSACSVTTPTQPETTQLLTSQCGTSLSNIYNTLFCTKPFGAEGYRFEISDATQSYIVDRNTNNVNVMQISGGAQFGTTYTIRIAVKYNGIYGSYGNACTVTTPAASTALTRMINCGGQAANRWSTHYCYQLPNATQYRFEISNGGQTLTYTNTRNVFQFANFTGWTANTVYSVRVAAFIAGFWQPYGSSCSITSPASLARYIHTDAAEPTEWNVRLYPNPSAHDFQLDLPAAYNLAVHVQAWDMTGKQIQNVEIDANDLVDTRMGSTWPTGVYLIQVQQGSEMQLIKWIKQ